MLNSPETTDPQRLNDLGQPVGEALIGWRKARRLKRAALTGRYCSLEPLDPDRHAAQLFAANSADPVRMWTYLSFGPFANFSEYHAWIVRMSVQKDPLTYAVISHATGQAVGTSSFLRVDRDNGVVEIGHLAFSPELQRTAASTEAIYLMLRRVFELGYRRCEWKCDTYNAPSLSAAYRYGFTLEGVFRQAQAYKGRTRDTAWFSIIDRDWPLMRGDLECWLDPVNFDPTGLQRLRLSELSRSSADRTL